MQKWLLAALALLAAFAGGAATEHSRQARAFAPVAHTRDSLEAKARADSAVYAGTVAALDSALARWRSLAGTAAPKLAPIVLGATRTPGQPPIPGVRISTFRNVEAEIPDSALRGRLDSTLAAGTAIAAACTALRTRCDEIRRQRDSALALLHAAPPPAPAGAQGAGLIEGYLGVGYGLSGAPWAARGGLGINAGPRWQVAAEAELPFAPHSSAALRIWASRHWRF